MSIMKRNWRLLISYIVEEILFISYIENFNETLENNVKFSFLFLFSSMHARTHLARSLDYVDLFLVFSFAENSRKSFHSSLPGIIPTIPSLILDTFTFGI